MDCQISWRSEHSPSIETDSLTMDGLAAGESVIAVVQSTGSIIKIYSEYLSRVKNAKENIECFQAKIAALKSALESLDELVRVRVSGATSQTVVCDPYPSIPRT